MRILGISAFYHDSAAVLVEDGRIVAAAQEERFTRKKHDARFPKSAIRWCIEAGQTTLEDVDRIVFYDKPFLKFERLLETYVAFAPRGYQSFRAAMPVWLKQKLFQKSLLSKELNAIAPISHVEDRLMFTEHHFSHAASAFYPSPYEEAVVLTLDGVGEWATGSVAHGRGSHLAIEREQYFPHSLGLLYSAVTYYAGFKVNSGEYKVMGLAPYGEPRFKNLMLDHVIDVKEDGSFWLDMKYFDYCTGLSMTSELFSELFGRPPRKPDSELLDQFHMDMAASVQAVTEEVMLRLARALARDYDTPNLCLAGGVALNCVANGKLLRDGAFRNIWVQPAAGDAGGALGSALAVWHMAEAGPRRTTGYDAMEGSFLGPDFPQPEIERRLAAVGASFETMPEDRIIEETVDELTGQSAVGWFQGRMEFGPRALGARSILADPRSPTMQRTLNLRVKYRESFRPFAPSVLREDVADWFDFNVDSPYMLMVADLLPKRRRQMTGSEQALFGIDKLNVVRSEIPAVTHVDYSARIQTVHANTNARYHRLLSFFKQRTGCPVLVNTSFNVRGEPIVCTPEDAFRCFMGSEIEILVVGNCFLRKEHQDPDIHFTYEDIFDLD
ncbi:MAG: carbamoyltransferase [Alphaproteobacteria bacterium]|jgi:carbamoyltransferase|nr:carbamoyltransferase [Alphaproteobacteria bacterium]